MELAAVGAVLGVVAQELYLATVAACERSTSFRYELKLLQSTLKIVTPEINHIDELTTKNPESFPREVLEEIQMFKALLVRGKVLVMTCSEIPRWRILKKYRYTKKITTLNESLRNLIKIHLHGLQLDVILRVLTQTNQMNQKLVRNDIQHQFSLIPNSSPVNPDPRINETGYQSNVTAIYCCSFCCFHGPACTVSHQ